MQYATYGRTAAVDAPASLATLPDDWASTPWSVAVATSADADAAGDLWLTAEERAACGRLVSDAARADFRASRLAARRALTALGGSSSPATLSLSHRLGRGAAAAVPAASGVRVGVDLELGGSVPPECARYFLTAAERDEGARGNVDLAALWALKEAAWKALAVRDTVCFSALELAIDPRASSMVRAVTLHGRTRPAAGAVSEPWPGWRLAVVRVACGERS